MNVLRNNRHEEFAQAVAEGRTHREAALKSGYSPRCAASIGAQLARLPDVRARILELSGPNPAPQSC
jgi:phage terminase small subunit